MNERESQDVFDRWTLIRVLIKQATDKVFEVVGIHCRDGGITFLNDFPNEAQEVIGIEGVLELTHFVQDTAERPNIRLVRVRFVLAHFRTHRIRGTHHRHGEFVGGAQHTCDTKVPQSHTPSLRDEYVLRLQISMYDFSSMAVLHRQSDLHKHVNDIIFAKDHSIFDGIPDLHS